MVGQRSEALAEGSGWQDKGSGQIGSGQRARWRELLVSVPPAGNHLLPAEQLLPHLAHLTSMRVGPQEWCLWRTGTDMRSPRLSKACLGRLSASSQVQMLAWRGKECPASQATLSNPDCCALEALTHQRSAAGLAEPQGLCLATRLDAPGPHTGAVAWLSTRQSPAGGPPHGCRSQCSSCFWQRAERCRGRHSRAHRAGQGERVELPAAAQAGAHEQAPAGAAGRSGAPQRKGWL